MDFIQRHNCKLTVGRDCFELTLDGRTMCHAEEKSPPRCTRIAVGVTTVIPPKREALVPVRLVDPCNDAELGVTQGRLQFMKKSQLFVANSLVNVQRGI